MTSCGRRRDGIATTAPGRSAQSQAPSTRAHALEQLVVRRHVGDRAPHRARRTRRPGPPRCRGASRSSVTTPPTPSSPSRVRSRWPQPRSVSRATARPGSSCVGRRDLALHVDAEPVGAGRPLRPGRQLDAGPVERGRGRLGGGLRARRRSTRGRRRRRSGRRARPSGRRAPAAGRPSGTRPRRPAGRRRSSPAARPRGCAVTRAYRSAS